MPRLWPGETFVCLGGGPSLTAEDVQATKDVAWAIAINDAWRLAPWAVALMASDARWWRHHRGVPAFRGRKYCLQREAAGLKDVVILRNTGTVGVETHPSGLRTGSHSGAAAINLAVHFGAARILLLGYDLQRTQAKAHWFGDHPDGLQVDSPFHLFKAGLASMVEPLRTLGVEVINCSRETALTCFPCQSLEEALSR